MKKFSLIIFIILLLVSPIFAERSGIFEGSSSDVESSGSVGFSYAYENINFDHDGLILNFNTKDHLFGFSFLSNTLVGSKAFRFGGFASVTALFGIDSLSGGTRPAALDKHIGANISFGPSISYNFLPYLSVYDLVGASITFNDFIEDSDNSISFLTFGIYNELGVKLDLVKGTSVQLSGAFIYDFGGIYKVKILSNTGEIHGKYSAFQIRPTISVTQSFTRSNRRGSYSDHTNTNYFY